MNCWFMRGGVAIATMALLQTAFGKEVVAPKYTPPQIVQRPDNFDACHAESAWDKRYDEKPSLSLTIAADGSLKKFSLPEGSPDWMKELSGCGLDRLQFTAGTRDGVPTEQSAHLEIQFVARDPEQPTGIAIGKVGPLITPPRIWRRGADTQSCFRHAKLGVLSRFVVSVTILPDGAATELILPTGSEPWQDEIARCVVDRVKFTAGTRDGMPVSASATLPIVAMYESGDVSVPKLSSSNEELEAAYRACYPSDLASMTSVFYRFEVASNGRVSNPKVVKGSGDPRLDEAGVCILNLLEFTPLMQSGRAIRSSATWELPLRPPR